MGGGVGSIDLRTILNNIGNLMISDLGAAFCIIALGIALLVAMFGGPGGGGRAGNVILFVILFYSCGFLLAEVTGTANPLGGVGAIFAAVHSVATMFA